MKGNIEAHRSSINQGKLLERIIPKSQWINPTTTYFMFISPSNAGQVVLLQAVTQGPTLLPSYGSAILWLSSFFGIIQPVARKKREWKIVHPILKHFHSAVVHVASTHTLLVRTAHKSHWYARRAGEDCSYLTALPATTLPCERGAWVFGVLCPQGPVTKKEPLAKCSINIV